MRYALEKIAFENALAAKDAEIAALDAEIARLRHELAARDAAIKDLIANVVASDKAAEAFIENLTRQILSLQAEVDDLDDVALEADRDATIALEIVDQRDAHIDTLRLALLQRLPPLPDAH